MATTLTVRAAPSIALIKYWGKQDVAGNLPATSSLAVTITGLFTEARVALSDAAADQLVIEGYEVPAERHAAFFAEVRRRFGVTQRFVIEARNNFPTGAGLASSASVFAAAAIGCAQLLWRNGQGQGPGNDEGAGDGGGDLQLCSELARVGSASAARAVWGGFTALEAGASAAYPAFAEDHWPELRLLVVVTSRRPKKVASRAGMVQVAATSPYYAAWVADAPPIFAAACAAVAARDLARLGPLMRASYLRMFGTMLSADPPINYLLPASVAVWQVLEALRADGVAAWETMDAGPQVKIACLAADVARVRAALRHDAGIDEQDLIETAPGPGPQVQG